MTFTGETPAAALKKAQLECGEDPLVVNTKEIRKKTLTTPALYELVVAFDDSLKKAPELSAHSKKSNFVETPDEKDEVVFSISEIAKQMSKIEKLSDPIVPKAQVEPQIKPKPAPKQPEPEEMKVIKDQVAKLVDNVNLIKNMIWDNNEPGRDGLVIPPEFAEIYKIARDSGMANEHLSDIMRLTLENMPHKMKESCETVKRYFNVLLRKLVPVRHELKLSPQNKRILMFVGPTGVGKTTTLAKLAARFAYKQEIKYKVGIITLDTYRIGAVEQLMNYAKMMRLGIEAVVDPSEFSVALNTLKNCDCILIDTVGSSQYDKEKISKISNFLKAERSLSIDTVLVLCANSKLEDLRDSYKNFSSAIDIDTIVITKLDETKGFGNIFSLIYETKKPVSYFSTGQDVPDDIMVASTDFFIECLLDGYKSKSNRNG